MPRTDEELVISYRGGDESALEELFGRHLKAVYGFIRRLANDSPESDDIVQDTFVKAWRNLRQFDSGRRFRPWLFRIAKNTALDHFRKKQHLPFSSFEDESGNNMMEDSLVDESPLPDELISRREVGEMLDASLLEVPAIYREVLVLRYGEEFTFEEIAEILGSPLNTVKSRNRRGLAVLRKKLEGGMDGQPVMHHSLKK